MIEQPYPPYEAARWFRAPARQQDEWIVLDAEGGEWYDPRVEPDLWMEVQRVTSPADAVKFAARFGLLANKPLAAKELEEVPYLQGVKTPLRQEYRAFDSNATEIRSLLQMALDIQKARDGDLDAFKRLSRRVLDRRARLIGGVRSLFKSEEESSAVVFERAGHEIAEAVTLYGGRVVFSPDVPQGSRAIIGRSVGFGTLSQYCYFTLGEALSRDVRLGECGSCGLIFVMKDARQRFCEPACATRARSRRYYTGTKKKRQDS